MAGALTAVSDEGLLVSISKENLVEQIQLGMFISAISFVAVVVISIIITVYCFFSDYLILFMFNLSTSQLFSCHFLLIFIFYFFFYIYLTIIS